MLVDTAFKVKWQNITSPSGRDYCYTQAILEITPAFTPGADFKDILPAYVESFRHYYTTAEMTVIELAYPDYLVWDMEAGVWQPCSEHTPGATRVNTDNLTDLIALKLTSPSHIRP